MAAIIARPVVTPFTLNHRNKATGVIVKERPRLVIALESDSKALVVNISGRDEELACVSLQTHDIELWELARKNLAERLRIHL